MLCYSCRSINSLTSVDVMGSVITTGEARLEMFLPDTAAPTTGVATVTFIKVSFRESRAMGKRDDVRYREYSRPTVSSVTFVNTSAGSCTDILEASSSSELSFPLRPSLLFLSLLPLPDETGWSKTKEIFIRKRQQQNMQFIDVTIPKPDPDCICTRSFRSNVAPSSCNVSRSVCEDIDNNQPFIYSNTILVARGF